MIGAMTHDRSDGQMITGDSNLRDFLSLEVKRDGNVTESLKVNDGSALVKQ